MQVTQELRQFVTDNFLFGEANGSLNDGDSFLEKGIIDSTGVLELIMFVEERFGIAVKDQDLVPENFDSINNLARYIEGQFQLQS
jgi:acyl carrier protein